MFTKIAFIIIAVVFKFQFSYGHSHESKLLTSVSHLDERHHIGSHMNMVSDINDLAEDEVRFLYFKMHDSDDNSKLDGCELVKSLLHWHAEEHNEAGHDDFHVHGTTKIFGHNELALMIDPILASDDKNSDGFIDYPEFVAAQTARGF